MIFGFGKRKKDERPRELYAGIVEYARTPAFYAELGVDDSVDGRFEMILLHLFILFRRFRDEAPEHKQFSQDVFDTFIEDMDGSLRQMGVGYQRVPKKMRQIGEAFYGRIDAYDKALDEADSGKLTEVVSRNVFPQGDQADEGEAVTSQEKEAKTLSDYIRNSVHKMAEDDIEAVKNGLLNFADLPTSKANNN